MKVKENLLVLLVILSIAIITRLIPHYPNFTAVGAAALFGGAYFARHIAILIPVITLFVSNLILNNLIYRKEFPANYDGFVLFQPTSLWIYCAFILIALMASRFVRPTKVLSILGCTISASVIFFLVSNFGVWVHSPMYPATFAGLLMAYVAALPFFWSTVAGDLVFVGVFFGGLAFAKMYLPQLRAALPGVQ